MLEKLERAASVVLSRLSVLDGDLCTKVPPVKRGRKTGVTYNGYPDAARGVECQSEGVSLPKETLVVVS